MGTHGKFFVWKLLGLPSKTRGLAEVSCKGMFEVGWLTICCLFEITGTIYGNDDERKSKSSYSGKLRCNVLPPE